MNSCLKIKDRSRIKLNRFDEELDKDAAKLCIPQFQIVGHIYIYICMLIATVVVRS